MSLKKMSRGLGSLEIGDCQTCEGVAKSRGQDLNDNNNRRLDRRASLIVYSVLSRRLPWVGVEEGEDKLVESTKSRGNPLPLLSLQTFMTTFKDCLQDNVFVIIWLDLPPLQNLCEFKVFKYQMSYWAIYLILNQILYLSSQIIRKHRHRRNVTRHHSFSLLWQF